MKKPIMIHVLALFLISTLAGCASCSSDLKENGKENGKRGKARHRGSTSRIIRFG